MKMLLGGLAALILSGGTGVSSRAGIDIVIASVSAQNGQTLFVFEMNNPIRLLRNGVYFHVYCGVPERKLLQIAAATEEGMAQAKNLAAREGAVQLVLVPDGFPGNRTVEVTVATDVAAPSNCRAELRGVW